MHKNVARSADGGSNQRVNQSQWKIARREETGNETSRNPTTRPVKILTGPINTKSTKATDSAEASTSNVADRLTALGVEKTETNQAEAVCFPDPKQMTDAVRFIDDNDGMDFTDFCKEYLNDGNRRFSVVGAIGAQGTGKSTLLSMLAGNDPSDMYRQYVFRPCSRDANELCRYQTTKIYIYISKSRTIFLDCQAIASAPMTDEFIKGHRRQNQPMEQFDGLTVQLLSLMASICHTLLLCVDWFIDLNIIRELMRTTAFVSGKMTSVDKSLDSCVDRRLNIVVVHQRARPDAFHPLVVRERMNALRGLFECSRFNIHGNVNMSSLGFRRYAEIDSDVNYVLLGEMRSPPRRPNGEGDIASLSHHVNVAEYASVVTALRRKLLDLPRHPFRMSNSSTLSDQITEHEWYVMAARLWDRYTSESRSHC